MNYRHLLLSLSLGILAVLSIGCQHAPSVADSSDREIEQLLAGEVFIGKPLTNSSLLPDDKPFELTPEMKRFAHYHAKIFVPSLETVPPHMGNIEPQ